jgi:uncharacterized protein YnzC (UPF0291/DUF896 family)
MNNKNKNRLLIVGFFVVLFIAYSFSIKKTMEAKGLLTTLRSEKELQSNAQSKIFNLQQENAHLDSILRKKDLSIENSFQQTLLKKINSFAEKEKITIISFEEPHEVERNEIHLKTYFFEIKGNFRALLKLINELERQQLGQLVSVNFTKKKNYRTNRTALTCQFYIQKLKQ